jgi:hypothetical protein
MGGTRTIDPDGADYGDHEAAIARIRTDVWKMVGQEVIETGELHLARHIEIADEDGRVINAVRFGDTIRVI